MKTLNEILKYAGIKTIRTNLKSVVYLEYNGKKILRPNAERCYDKVLSEFNINLKEFE
jgi:hypothetical protein